MEVFAESPEVCRGADIEALTPMKAEPWSALSSPGPRLLALDSPRPDFSKIALTPQNWSQKAPGRTSRQTRLRPGRKSSEGSRGDVSLCVRLKPGCEEEIAYVEGDKVRLKPSEKGLLSFLGDDAGASRGAGKADFADWHVCCDHTFGTTSHQEEIFETAVAPIVDAVANGYNGAVIAYGQTGAGKTYTMIGPKGPCRGVAPRAVAGIFAGLRKASWRIEVSVLEVYNEKVRDLLAPGSTISTVEVHEVREREGLLSFRCPDAITWSAKTPEEAMAALTEGCRRREVARTDMNHHSSRSHLVFTLNVVQSDREAGATLRSRLHLVDLAGSERLKRSMVDSPRNRSSGRGLGAGAQTARSPRSDRQRREAGEINKSLSQLALVIQRLTAPGTQYVPYRDSMLTRLLAESFGGSSKTCLLVCCSPGIEDREETKSSLDFGRRAKMVRNKPTINLEVDSEPSAVMKALMAKELRQMQLDRDVLVSAHESLLQEVTSLREAAATSSRQQEATNLQCAQLEEQLREAQRIATDATDAFSELREARDSMEEHFLREADEHRSLLQASAQRVAALLEQQAKVDRSNLEVAAEAVRWQEGQSKAARKLEEQLLEARGELQSQVVALEQAKAALQQQHSKDLADLTRQLAEVRAEATRMQEEKAQLARRAQEDRSALLRHWHDEVMSLREEKANALGVAEAEKLSLRRRFQAELQELQRNKEETVSELERDKASLRDKWQAAMEEMGILQAQMVAAEERFKEELRARCAMFEDEKAEARRQCYDELGRLLEEKATEAARQSLDTAQLQRRLDEATANADQEKANLLARLEAEKATLQSQLQEVCNEKLRLSEEKAALAERQTSDLAKAQETWAGAFARELQASRELQREEATRLQTLVKSVSERHEESERQTSMLQAELAALQQHWPSSPPPKARWPTSPRREREGEGEGEGEGGSDPPSPKEELPPEVKQPEGEAQTETEPEGEFFPQGRDRRDLPRLGLPRRYPEMWSPSFKDLAEAPSGQWEHEYVEG